MQVVISLCFVFLVFVQLISHSVVDIVAQLSDVIATAVGSSSFVTVRRRRCRALDDSIEATGACRESDVMEGG